MQTRPHIQVIFGACILAWGVAHPFDFKGVTVGQPATPQVIQERLGVKCVAGANALQVCNGVVTLAGTASDMNLVIGADGVVQRISLPFASDGFDTVERATNEKFGPPKSITHEKVQNRMGATFDNVSYTWKATGGVEVLLSKYVGRVDSSLLYFSTTTDRELLENIEKQRSKDL